MTADITPSDTRVSRSLKDNLVAQLHRNTIHGPMHAPSKNVSTNDDVERTI